MFQEKFCLPHYGSGFEIDDVYRSKLSVRDIESPDVECALCQDTVTKEESYGAEFVIGSARKLLFALPGEEPQRVCGGCAFAHGDGHGHSDEDVDESDESDGFLEAA